jgi:phage baseplate assembly protein W
MKGISFYDKEFFTFKTGSDLYAEAIKRLLMTSPGERVGEPYFGVGLKQILFELADPVTMNNLQERLSVQAEMYLPMLTILDSNITLEENSLFVKVKFMEKDDLPTNAQELILEFGS